MTATASLGAFGLTLLFPGAHEPGLRGGEGASGGLRIAEAVRTMRGNRAVWYVILYSSLLFVLIRVSDTLFQPVLKNQGFNEVGVGFAFAGLSFVAAAAALQVAPGRCAVVEDTVTGVTAGVAAGATVFAYAPLDDGEALRAAGAAQVFRSMAELPALLGC